MTTMTKKEEAQAIRDIEPHVHKLVATKFSNCCVTHEDLVQEALIRLVSAIREQWDASGTASFRSWALSVARHAIMDVVRDANVRRRSLREASMDAPFSEEDGPESLHDVLGTGPDQEASLMRFEMTSVIQKKIKALPSERMREVVAMRVSEGRPTQTEVGIALGIDASRVCRLEANALALLEKRNARERAS